MSVKVLKEILEEIDHPVLIEIIDCMWCADKVEAHWNKDDNKDDLMEGEGSSYSVEIRGSTSEYDGYLVLNADTGCGETVTYLFNLEKEVKF